MDFGLPSAVVTGLAASVGIAAVAVPLALMNWKPATLETIKLKANEGKFSRPLAFHELEGKVELVVDFRAPEQNGLIITWTLVYNDQEDAKKTHTLTAEQKGNEVVLKPVTEGWDAYLKAAKAAAAKHVYVHFVANADVSVVAATVPNTTGTAKLIRENPTYLQVVSREQAK
jgi:hypothetical protein